MKQRCLNKKHLNYKNYGGRGIIVCKRWMSFENFYTDMGDRPKGKTLDRIDNNKNYVPENCRWATPREQRLNTRKNDSIFKKSIKINKERVFSNAHKKRLSEVRKGMHHSEETKIKIRIALLAKSELRLALGQYIPNKGMRYKKGMDK